jgi:catechol 2,3-dioxygenase-like lactoylglutathione lyase family enzyme
MTIERMDHVGVVVDDLAAATAFFVELGLERQGAGQVEGDWVDRIVGLEGVRVDFAMMQTPDGHGKLELVKFHAPSGPGWWGRPVRFGRTSTARDEGDGCGAFARRVRGSGAGAVGCGCSVAKGGSTATARAPSYPVSLNRPPDVGRATPDRAGRPDAHNAAPQARTSPQPAPSLPAVDVRNNVLGSCS